MFDVNDARVALWGELQVLIGKGPERAFWIRLMDRITVLFYFIEPQLGAVEAEPQDTAIFGNGTCYVQQSLRSFSVFRR
jgi:hypothetical protein